jgi:hypothetical protein
MRLRTLASLSLCAVLSASCGRKSESTQPPEQVAQGPGSDSCAVYVQRVAAGVRCTEVDASHCSCELIAEAAPATIGGDPGTSGGPPLLTTDPGAGAVTPPQAPPASSTATLAFAPGPANTIVICRSGPCPVATAELITAPYPPVPAAPGGTQIQLEFHAAGHKPYTGNYTLYPGTNQIAFTLEQAKIALPDSAILTFQGAPDGATVECVSGPCPDNKPHSLDSFPPIKLAKDDQTLLLRFNAPGHRTGMSSFQVSRGPNVIPVLMEKGTNGKNR